MMNQKMETPCGDCVDGYCTMNCGQKPNLRTLLNVAFGNPAQFHQMIDTHWPEIDRALAVEPILRKMLAQASDELYGDPEAHIGGWKERAQRAEDGLRAIAGMSGKTLIENVPEVQDYRVRGAGLVIGLGAYSAGATEAFQQCASLATGFLDKARE